MPDQNGNTTWSDVKSTIAFRLNRPNLDPNFIQFMSEEVTTNLASEGFWPSQVTNTQITTQPGQYFYLLPNGLVKILFIRFLLTQVWIPLTWVRRYEDILLSDPVQPPFTAIPSQARAFGRMLRLFPTPNSNYPLELTVEQRVAVPTDDDDTTNFWVDEGRPLMVAKVCAKIAREYLRDMDRATTFDDAAIEAMDAVESISHSRNGPKLMEQS